MYFFSQLDVLEYIHENEYVHGDIKAANLLLGYKNPDQVNKILSFAFSKGLQSTKLRHSKNKLLTQKGLQMRTWHGECCDFSCLAHLI